MRQDTAIERMQADASKAVADDAKRYMII